MKRPMHDSDAAVTVDAIWRAVDRPHTRNRAFQSVFRRGIRDRLAGASRQQNPYPDHGTFYHNGVTFSRAFRRYWTDGWKAADQYLQDHT
jgi:hypothetical protein